MGVFLPVILLLIAIGYGLFAFFQKRERTLVGVLAGLGVIALVWLGSEVWLYLGCLACRRRECEQIPQLCGSSLCCEWIGVGMLAFSLVAAIAIGGFLASVALSRWVEVRQSSER